MFHMFSQCCPSFLDWEENLREKWDHCLQHFIWIGSMKRHVKAKHLEIIITYVEKVVADNISRS